MKECRLGGSAVRVKLCILAAGAGLLVSVLPVLAHHSFAAEYDATKKIELKGVVTKFEWTNPHAHFYLDVTGADGKVANWNLELASPNMMVRNGWTRHSLKEGDQVVVVLSRAKDGTNTGSADTITLASGRRLTFMAAPPDDGAKPEAGTK
jgi:hypothetical protein